MLAETAIKIGKSRNKQDWEQDTERTQAKQNTKTNKMNNTDPTKYREDEHSCPQSLKDDEQRTSFYKLKIDLSCAFIQLDFTITFIVAWCFY